MAKGERGPWSPVVCVHDTIRTGFPMEKSSLHTVVSVAEIISALAVVLSLLYAGYEFRRSQTLKSADVMKVLYDRVALLEQMMVENADLAEVTVKLRNGQGVSSSDTLRFLSYEHIFYDTWELGFDSYETGIIEKEHWQTWSDWFTRESARRPQLGWVGNKRHFTDRRFVEKVEEARESETLR